jgi:hypothetical protein
VSDRVVYDTVESKKKDGEDVRLAKIAEAITASIRRHLLRPEDTLVLLEDGWPNVSYSLVNMTC